MSTTVENIIEVLEELVPPNLAESWDNVGLMVGRRNAEVKRVMLALDITEEVVRQAMEAKCQMIITHHPAIFKGLKHITDDNWQQKLLLTLIENRIAVYSAHTNLDSVCNGVNNSLVKLLQLKDAEILDDESKIGRIGFTEKQELRSFAEFVKKALKADYAVMASAGKAVHKVAVCGGAGSDFIDIALAKGADTLVTGDMKYHEAQRAVFSGLNIIDAGHQSTELPVLEDLADILSLYFTNRNLDISIKVAKETLLLKHV